jgi:hypothetical protein
MCEAGAQELRIWWYLVFERDYNDLDPDLGENQSGCSSRRLFSPGAGRTRTDPDIHRLLTAGWGTNSARPRQLLQLDHPAK